MMDVPAPLAVRRRVSFSEAIYDDTAVVEQVRADIAQTLADVDDVWNRGAIAVLVDPEWQIIKSMRPAVVVDAILAKRNLGTRLDDAELVIGLGPGFYRGRRHACCHRNQSWPRFGTNYPKRYPSMFSAIVMGNLNPEPRFYNFDEKTFT